MSSNSFVKILIKAPNQLVDDQTVHCERSWTVKRLKHHLANVYPCKPHPDGQKLIYSGQLLSDEAVLSDILRSYDGMENNTIHLVCSMRDSHKIIRQTTKTTQPTSYPVSHENTHAWRGNDLGPQNPNPRPTGPVMFPPIDTSSQTIVQQNILFQQAYLNYMAHFSHMYLMANRMGTSDNSQFPQNVMNVNPPGNNLNNNNNNADVPVNERNDDEVDEGRDENRANRDWLEWFYIISRLFILFTVVYFYSSPERFIMVIAMALILINIDVFRWRRGHNPVETPPGENNIDLPLSPENPVEQPSWIHITWTFMKTFFLSLVPDNREI